MSTSCRQAIEQIAQREDRALAIVFFLFFSRFEYALKRAGFVRGLDDAQADWAEYGRRHVTLLQADQDDSFRQAVDYLRQSPPKKQVVTNGILAWNADRYTADFDLGRVLTLVCRTRNNLFHGGKFPKGHEPDISRDRHLLEVGLTIMQACLDHDETLRHIFLEALE